MLLSQGETQPSGKTHSTVIFYDFTVYLTHSNTFHSACVLYSGSTVVAGGGGV